ncbi:phosphatase PAP2 family protein [Lutibacter aestuarii]|uniref:Phosphatase PAP2 family protein n=1 Tax=Lutibacter aestuarii TaxID=861111 RepID=A0ABW2Z5J7_9FLAO|nr:phosphatase PAP2 family protein [uncultured Lutibacter sp.]
MELLNSLIEYDKQLLLFLHSKGSINWDNFWLFITNPINWIWLFLVIFFLGNKVLGLKKALIVSTCLTLSSLFALWLVTIIKNYVQRLRPINDTSINNSVRVLIEQNDFSFVSGHSTVSFTIAFLSFWILKRYYKFTYLFFLFPILFAYSRIYLAVHYPLDILVGMFLGFLISLVTYKIMSIYILKP